MRSSKPTDIIIDDVSYQYDEFRYRAPYQFGGRTVDRATILNVRCTVHARNGRVAKGFAAMPLGNVWAFPSKTMSYDTTLGAMKVLADRVSKITAAGKIWGHPVEINSELEPEYLKAAEEVSRELKLAAPIPKLCTQVTASPFDAAIHDAFGKLHGLNCYSTYGPDFFNYDLSRYLGRDFAGEYLEQYVKRQPAPRTPLFHSVGAGDAITDADLKHRLNDGLPETLPDWIQYNGLIRVKIKLNGEDLAGDIDRTVRIDRVTAETQKKRGVDEWFYCLDFNENCPDVAFVLEFLRKVKEQTEKGFYRIQYVEQPTARDLKANRSNVMHQASQLRPVVIDESSDRPGKPDAGKRDGLHGRGAQGVQGTEPGAADGRGSAEAQDVSLRSGSHLSGRGADPLGRSRGSRAGLFGNRGQCPAVRARRESALGSKIPRNLSHQRRHVANQHSHRPRSRRRAGLSGGREPRSHRQGAKTPIVIP